MLPACLLPPSPQGLTMRTRISKIPNGFRSSPPRRHHHRHRHRFQPSPYGAKALLPQSISRSLHSCRCASQPSSPLPAGSTTATTDSTSFSVVRWVSCSAGSASVCTTYRSNAVTAGRGPPGAVDTRSSGGSASPIWSAQKAGPATRQLQGYKSMVTMVFVRTFDLER